MIGGEPRVWSEGQGEAKEAEKTSGRARGGGFFEHNMKLNNWVSKYLYLDQ